MQITLAESAARTARPSPWIGASLIAHGAAVSMLLLRGVTSPELFVPEQVVLTYVETRQEPAPPPVPDDPTRAIVAGSDAPVIPIPILDIPTVVLAPPVDLTLAPPAIDASAFDRRGLAPTPGLAGSTASGSRPALGAVYHASAVDVAVRPMAGNPSPAYPRALSSAGVEGEVAMRFVVDTSGRVESGSATTVRASHALFEREVRDALHRMRFLPAESGGAKVRQLVEQVFRFEISRRGGDGAPDEPSPHTDAASRTTHAGNGV